METVWRKYFTAMNNDRRINVWHLTLFMTLVCYWELGGCKNPISITRREVMKMSHFGSLPTYHKYMKELIEFGYINYLPSYHPILGSLVWINATDEQPLE
jgi:hypothetical protein